MLALIAQALLSGSGVTATLSAEAHVRGTEIELAEIARIAGLDPELVARVGALEIGAAPAPGYSRLLTQERVEDALRRALPGVEVRLEGRACRVWPAVAEVGARALEESARAALARAFAERDAAFALHEPLSSVKVPAGGVEPALFARVPAGELASGIIDVPVEIHVDGTRYRTIWTAWQVEVWETRPALARAVRAGEALAPDQFEPRRMKVVQETRPEPLDPIQVRGAVAKRDLAPGELVTSLDVHRPAAVTLGSQLFLRVKKGSIEASVSVVALETGAVGDRVRVKAIDSGKELSAFVTGRDQCEIVLAR